MKVALIGPGTMTIPPKGWGAVETIIDLYRRALEQRGIEVKVFNLSTERDIIENVNAFAPDFVHCHFDDHIGALTKISCPHKAITSHYGYLDQVWRFPKYLSRIHRPIVDADDVHVFALSDSIAEVYRSQGVSGERIRVVPNGVEFSSFTFSPDPRFADHSLCLGQINKRKRQAQLQAWNLGIDFVGPVAGGAQGVGFDRENSDYLGEWSRDDVHRRLTDYANLVLLSDGEAHALVCMEALAAGLGLVVSEWATANLDVDLPFIDVIPESRINNHAYVSEVIARNRQVSRGMRDQIREYAKGFDWAFRMDAYVDEVRNIIQKKPVVVRAEPERLKKRVAILTTATGAYFDIFFRDFEQSVFNVLAPKIDPVIYCFTDRSESGSQNTKLVPVQHLGWPFASLMRFHFMQDIADELASFDFILAMDSDMIVRKSFEESLFEQDFVAVLHPSFFGATHKAPFELDPESEAFIPPGKRQSYVQGCFFGGKPTQFNYLTKLLQDIISRDLSRGIVPIWHDESYLNWFFANHAFKPVSPAYALPEDTRIKLSPYVIHRKKPHHEIRKTEAVLDWACALSACEQSDLIRQMYLRSHEKTQRLERIIIRSTGRMTMLVNKIKGLFHKAKK